MEARGIFRDPVSRSFLDKARAAAVDIPVVIGEVVKAGLRDCAATMIAALVKLRSKATARLNARPVVKLRPIAIARAFLLAGRTSTAPS